VRAKGLFNTEFTEGTEERKREKTKDNAEAQSALRCAEKDETRNSKYGIQSS
jgi:hypothetical protein